MYVGCVEPVYGRSRCFVALYLAQLMGKEVPYVGVGGDCEGGHWGGSSLVVVLGRAVCGWYRR